MSQEPEVVKAFPAIRDPALPPFFVWRVYNDEQCLICGTRRDGVAEAGAVPLEIPGFGKSHHGWISLQQASEIALALNKLHKEGRIDWSGNFPKVADSKNP